MSIFCTRHPIIALCMVGLVCATLASVAKTIADSNKTVDKNKENNKVESIEE